MNNNSSASVRTIAQHLSLLQLFIMYEPIIIKKKRPNSFVGTPAGKVNVFVNITLAAIPMLFFYPLSIFLVKRSRLIAELNGNYNTKSLMPDDELNEAKSFWTKPQLSGVIAEVQRRAIQKANNATETAST